MQYTLLRNATAMLEYGGHRVLIDPALDPAGHRPPVANTANPRRNPLVELPGSWQELISEPDALLVTHLHSDHFDTTAQSLLAGDTLTFCQPEDAAILRDRGFPETKPIDSEIRWDGITISRTEGNHGTGEVGRLMAPVSGFVLSASNEPTVYVAGDTIWYENVAEVVSTHDPDVIVVNASGASFLEGGKIVMDAADILQVQLAVPEARIVVVHLEAINHCHETRDYYRHSLPELGADLSRIVILEDGESTS